MWASEVLPRPGRPGEQHVVERLVALAGRLDEDRQLVGDLLLVDEVGKGAWAAASGRVLVLRASARGVVDADVLGRRRHRQAGRARRSRWVRMRSLIGLLREAPALRRAAASSCSGVFAIDAFEQLLGLAAARSRG